VPAQGGDTLFASMYAAYEALSDRMKTYLEGLNAIHDGESVYRGLYKNSVSRKEHYPRAVHPAVRTIQVTGKKALYVNRGFTRGLVGVPRDESDGILTYLYQHMENPLFRAASAGARTRSRSGTIAASSTAPCGITAAHAQRQPRHRRRRQAVLNSRLGDVTALCWHCGRAPHRRWCFDAFVGLPTVRNIPWRAFAADAA